MLGAVSGGHSVTVPVLALVNRSVAEPVAGCQLRPRRALAEVGPAPQPDFLDEAPGPENGGDLFGGSRGARQRQTQGLDTGQRIASGGAIGNDPANVPSSGHGRRRARASVMAPMAGRPPGRRRAISQDTAVTNSRDSTPALRASGDYILVINSARTPLPGVGQSARTYLLE